MRVCLGICAALIVLFVALVLNKPAIPEDLLLTIEEKAQRDGYTAETYDATTDDGFILRLFRVHRSPGRPVLLLHGFGLSPESFVFNVYNTSLAYRLADAGFDVWLGCNRGNQHTSHLFLTRDMEEFWEWSGSEMVLFDVPALIYRVLNLTHHSKLLLIGHSQGGTISISSLAIYPELNAKISAIAMLGSPPGRIPELPFVFRVLSSRWVQRILHLFGVHSLLHPPKPLAVKIAHYLPIFGSFFVAPAFNPELRGDDSGLATLASSRLLGGTSVKSLEYVRQVHSNCTFAVPNMFDYGPTLNTLIYHSHHPASINISDIRVPVGYFIGKVDEFVTEWERKLMKSMLGKQCEVFNEEYQNDHMGLLVSGDMQYWPDLLTFLTNK